jgi:rhamnogalacturonan endolyase
MSRRQLVIVLYFCLLIGLSGSFVSLAKPAAAAATATTCATDTTTAITATNGLVAFTLSKSSGQITSLQVHGKELLGNGGVAYWDMNDSAFGTFDLGSSDAANTTYAVACPANGSFIDVSITHQGSSVEPMSISQHYILQPGIPAIHLFTVISHRSSLASDTIAQFRFVMRGDPKIFTHASVEDDPIGPAWRESASTFPTPQQIAQAPEAQDATYDLQGLNSTYPKRYYTKYDWSVYYRNHVLHGFYGNGYGAWMTMEHNESFNGGPTHQDLTVHQTTTTPVVLNMEQSTHFGGPPIVATGNWSKTYGPYLLYLNTGTDSTTLRNDALKYTNPTWDQAFYDTLGIPGYATSSQRSTVTGKVTLSDGNTMSESTVVLSDNKTDFTRTWQGYQYWASVNADGTFRLPGVRPGTYRLSVYRPHYFGAFQMDNVTIPAGTTYTLPSQVWTPPTFGSQIWQIGEPDRTSAEFMNGANFRNYGNYLLFPQQFPNSVDYVVGKSTAATGWNYTQYQVNNGVRLPDWKVQFNLAHAPTKGSIATLTIALAGWSLDIPGLPVGTPPLPGSLTVIVNGVKLPAWVLPSDAPDSASYRSGASGDYHLDYIQFSASSLLIAGTNTLAFRLNDGSTAAFNNAQYDALRFEIH